MFENIRIGLKIGLGFGFVMALLAISVLFGVFGLKSSEHGILSYSQMAQETNTASNTRNNMLQVRLALLDYLKTHEADYLDAYQADVEQVAALLQQLQGSISQPEQQQQVQGTTAALEEYRQQVGLMVELVHTTDKTIHDVLKVSGEQMTASVGEIIQSAREEDDAPVMFYAVEVQQALMAARLYSEQYLSSLKREDYNRALMFLEQDVHDRAVELSANLEAAHQQVKYSNYQSESGTYLETLQQLYQLFQQLEQVQQRVDQHERLILENLEQVSASVTSEQAVLGSELKSDIASRVTVLAVITCIALGIGAAFSLYMSRVISRPLGLAVRAANSLTEGDLRVNIDCRQQDEVGQLLQAMQQTASSLKEMIGHISSSTSEMSRATDQMSATSERSLQGIMRQQEETDQVAAAMEEMATSVAGVAESATQAADAAEKANAEADTGFGIVDQTGKTIRALSDNATLTEQQINELAQRSENIGGILDVIRDIADQTNLLALNAAIEAARAGDQGRGFAVVADEVRSLAKRTQDSTQEIQQLIEQLQQGARAAAISMQQGREQADHCVVQAAEAGSALDSITRAVGMINQMNMQIAQAAQEQTSVAENVSRSVVSVRDITEQSARASAETSRVSSEISQIASRLEQMVSRFRI